MCVVCSCVFTHLKISSVITSLGTSGVATVKFLFWGLSLILCGSGSGPSASWVLKRT